jgi:TonB-linked SusC/RagA family outer membrane protein
MRSTGCASPFPDRRKEAPIAKIVQFAILLLILSISLHATPYAQESVTLNVKNASLENVLKEIRRQTGYLYALQDQWKEKAKPIDIDVNHVPLDEALGLIFKSQPFTYAIVGKTIVIKEKEVLVPPRALDGIPSLVIGGQVLNEAGEELAGANVTIKETEKGTITNARGEFVLPGVSLNSTLIVSFIGYAPQRIMIKDATSLRIYLKVAKDELDKAVVQAYGTTTQRLATSNIGTVRAEDIAKQPVMDVLDVLQGQVPGAIVTNTSGYASATKKVEIEGRNTINPNFPSDPLYIIDGVPLTVNELTDFSSYNQGEVGVFQTGIASYAGGQSRFFNINPADIESIQVLKDADATAIYGSRGANGVILVTTKKGKAGKTNFEFSLYDGSDFVTRQYSLMNTSQYIAMRKEALANDGLPINVNNASDLVFGDSTRNINWQKYLWGRFGQNTDAEASLSGGNNTTSFRISSGYHYQQDLTALSGGNTRVSFSLNLNHKSLSQRLNMGITAGYSYALTNQVGLPSFPTLPPNAPNVFDKYGNLNYSGWDTYFGSIVSNPFFELLQPYSASTNFLNSNFTLSYEIARGLTFKANLGYNNEQGNQIYTMPIASQEPALDPTGTIQIGNVVNHNVISEPQLDFTHFIGKGKVELLAGATDQINITKAISIAGYGIQNDALLNEIAGAPSQAENYSEAEYKYAGIFARGNYNWENKYILNINARRDGSSRFGPGRQYGNFGSAGAAWIFTEEDWVKKSLSFLNFGKLRVSYGLTGGDQIGNYQYLTQWAFSQFPYNGISPLTPLKHTDSLFHWQVNKKFDAGIDLSFLKDRITLDLSHYINRTDNQLLNQPTPNFTGFSSVLTNNPANVQNSGWQSTITAKIIDDRDFKWTLRFSIGTNVNKLISYPNLAQSPYASQFVIGKSLNIKRVLHWTGIDPQTGLYTFEDKNKDGNITYSPSPAQTDDSYAVNMAPKFDGSANFDFLYRHFELGVFFYFRNQIGQKAIAFLPPAGGQVNQPTEMINSHWKMPGDIALFPRYTTNPSDISFSNYTLSDGILTDASFIRLQNLILSYAPSNHFGIKGMENCKITVRGQNLFVITHFKGTDPEVQNLGAMPLPKVVTLGLSFNF